MAHHRSIRDAKKEKMNVGINLYLMLTTFRKLLGHGLPNPSVEYSLFSGGAIDRANGKEATTNPILNQPSTALTTTATEDADMEVTNDNVDNTVCGKILICSHITWHMNIVFSSLNRPFTTN